MVAGRDRGVDAIAVPLSGSRPPGLGAALSHALAVLAVLADRVEVGFVPHLVHLLRLVELPDPREQRHGAQTLRIGIVEQMSSMERFFVAS